MEWGVLRRVGVEYIPRDALHNVSVADFSVSADGRWATSCRGMRRGARGQVVNEVVLHDLDGQTARQLHLSGIRPGKVAISPNAELLAIGCHDCSVYVMRCASGSIDYGSLDRLWCVLRDSRDTVIKRLVFSHGGRWLAVAGDCDIHLLAVRQGANHLPRMLCQSVCDADSVSLAFTADSRHLVVLDRRGVVNWWDTNTGQPVGRRTLADAPAVATALSADGTLASLVVADGRMHCWDLRSGQELWRQFEAGLQWRSPLPPALAFSPDGCLLATACSAYGRYAIHCYDVTTGKCLNGWPQYEPALKGLVVSGDLIYSWGSRANVKARNVATGRHQSVIAPKH